MVVDARTAKRDYTKPDVANTIREDFVRIIQAHEAIALDIDRLMTTVATLAPATHKHDITDVTGLQTALDGKARSDHKHSLSSLSDVDVNGAASGMLLGRGVNGWQPFEAKWDAGVINGGTFGADRIPNLPKSKVGLDKVDNTADKDKPVSDATAAELAKRVRVDAAQKLTDAEKKQARDNISAMDSNGSNATGEWNISIKGNAATAANASNADKLGGQPPNYYAILGYNEFPNYQVFKAQDHHQTENRAPSAAHHARSLYHIPGNAHVFAGLCTDKVFRIGGGAFHGDWFHLNSSGHLHLSGYGWLHDRFADRNAQVQRASNTMEFGPVSMSNAGSSFVVPAPWIVVGLRYDYGGIDRANTIYLIAAWYRNN